MAGKKTVKIGYVNRYRKWCFTDEARGILMAAYCEHLANVASPRRAFEALKNEIEESWPHKEREEWKKVELTALKYWRYKYPNFKKAWDEAVEACVGVDTHEALAVVHERLEKDGDVKTAKWLLERLDSRYRPRQDVNNTGTTVVRFDDGEGGEEEGE